MSANAAAMRGKVVGRGGRSQRLLARAEAIAAKNPGGRIAQRLRQREGVAGVTIDRKEPVNANGRKVPAQLSAGVVEDTRPAINVGMRFLKARIPGSPVSGRWARR